MVTLRDTGSDTVRLKSGSSHMDIKEKSIWVLMCKEKREKNGSISDFHHILDVCIFTWHLFLQLVKVHCDFTVLTGIVR